MDYSIFQRYIMSNELDFIRKCNKVVKRNVDSFTIEQFSRIYQNQVMILEAKSTLEDVDYNNINEGLNLVSNNFKDGIYDLYLFFPLRNMWVVKNNETIYGYIGVVVEYNIAVIHGIYLDKMLRGRGIADDLVEKAIEFSRVRGCNQMIIGVDKYHVRARAFFEKIGFTKYYIDRVHCSKLQVVYFYKNIG